MNTYKQFNRGGGRVTREHREIAELAFGKPLPRYVDVHHMNENKRDNTTPWNLIICTRAYHMLIHQRMDALSACGNANWVKCNICHQYDDPVNMSAIKSKNAFYHKKCASIYARSRKPKSSQRPNRWKYR